VPEPLEQLLLPLTGAALLAVVIITARVLRRDRDQRRADELSAWARAADEDTYRVAAAHLEGGDIALQLPAVRMLEDLAGSSAAYRQPVVDLLCGYLRRAPGNAHDRTVRRAIQQVITHLAAAGPQSSGRLLDLDLAGATLTNLDLSGAHIQTLTCTNARFEGETTFRGARILGAARCTAAAFEGSLRSEDVDYEDIVDFADAVFQADVSFSRCTFRGEARFAGATFTGPANLSQIVFLAAAVFSHPVDGPAWFRDIVDFHAACFTDATFADVPFPEGVDLTQAEFIRPPRLDGLHPALRAAITPNLRG
jgi:uncharacterized protein YjbI with pentapeptide repeats